MPNSTVDRPWTDAQVPEGDELFLDHVGYFIDDLDNAAAALERLGFSVSPINLQTNLGEDGVTRPSGTSNRLVRLRRGFLEFLAATHDTPLADQLLEARARYAGLHLIAISHADLEAQRARLVASGFDMQQMVHLRRHVREHGIEGEVAWSVLRPMPGVMPEGRIQYVYPHTPDLAWPPGSTEHPNGADSLTGILVCVADPAEGQERYAAFMDRQAGANGFETDRGFVRIVGVEEAAALLDAFEAPSLPFMAAATIATTDLDVTRRVLSDNGIAAQPDGDGALWVSPADALGGHLCFHAPGKAPF